MTIDSVTSFYPMYSWISVGWTHRPSRLKIGSGHPAFLQVSGEYLRGTKSAIGDARREDKPLVTRRKTIKRVRGVKTGNHN